MKAIVIGSESDGASNGGVETDILCADQKVHLLWCTSWYDQTGDEIHAYNSSNCRVIGPCDCSRRFQPFELSSEVSELVNQFLRDGSKGEIEKETLRYPPGSPVWQEYMRDIEQEKEDDD